MLIVLQGLDLASDFPRTGDGRIRALSWIWLVRLRKQIQMRDADSAPLCRISIFETRGNQAQYRLDQLNNEMVCGLHWGPANAPTYDRFYRTQGLYKGTSVLLHPRSSSDVLVQSIVTFSTKNTMSLVSIGRRIRYRFGLTAESELHSTLVLEDEHSLTWVNSDTATRMVQSFQIPGSHRLIRSSLPSTR